MKMEKCVETKQDQYVKVILKKKSIDSGENFVPVARLEGVRTLLAYVAHRGFKVYQMDVKSTYLKGILFEEVYIVQPEAFVDPTK